MLQCKYLSLLSLPVLYSPVQKGIGRLLVILMEGRDLLASDANGKEGEASFVYELALPLSVTLCAWNAAIECKHALIFTRMQ